MPMTEPEQGGASSRRALPALGRFEKWTLGLIAAAVIYQLVIPPIIGEADNGDFRRVSGPMSLTADTTGYNNLYWGHVNQKYRREPVADLRTFQSSQRWFVHVALLANALLSKDGLFDIVVLGSVHIVFYLLAVYVLLRAGMRFRRPVPYVFGVALAVIVTEVGYVAFFNSFYMEPASLIWLCFLLGAALTLAVQEKPRLWILLGYFVAGALFIRAKTQNVPLVLFVVAFGVYASWLWKRLWVKGLALVLAVALCLVAADMYQRGSPGLYKTQILWNTVFRNILPDSPDPAADLRELGLKPEWIEHKNRYSFDRPVGLPFDEYREAIGGMGKILLFHVRHPVRCYRLFQRCAKGTFVLRVEYLGNFTRESGMPWQSKSKAFALWGNFRAALIPRSLWFLAALFGSILIVSTVEYWHARSSGRLPALLPALVGTVALMAMAQFFVVVITDGIQSIEKHLWTFNFLCDACFVIVLTWLTSQATRLVERIRTARIGDGADGRVDPSAGAADGSRHCPVD